MVDFHYLALIQTHVHHVGGLRVLNQPRLVEHGLLESCTLGHELPISSRQMSFCDFCLIN